LPGWHIVTPEYPPQLGGVGDHTRVVAAELARTGDEVHVWTAGDQPDVSDAGVCVHRSFGGFGFGGIMRTARAWQKFPGPRRVLLQWVPQGFAMRGVNLPFCVWMWWRAAARGDEVEILFHEVRIGFGGSLRRRAAAVLQRLMVWFLVRAAKKLWMSTPLWEMHLAHSGKPCEWLPVPAGVPDLAVESEVAAARQRFAPEGTMLIGHFAAGPSLNLPLLMDVARRLLKRSDAVLLLIGGAGAARESLQAAMPDSASRIQDTGLLSPEAVAAHLAACDLVLQPYIDGISTRRSGAMAALANGCALVSTRGRATEALWLTAGCVALADAKDPAQIAGVAAELMDNPAERRRLGEAARGFYHSHFAVALIAERLRGAARSERMAVKA
jgi:glycosyltransferase involved in cell wall biosynthesis